MGVTPDGGTRRYLTFSLDQDLFGLAISRVRGVVDAAAVNRVFDGHECVCGVVNLGGNVAPVVDLRPRLADRRGEGAADTCVIVAEVDSGAEKTMVGILAGGACDVVSLGPSETDSCRPGGRPLRVLDPDRLFPPDELAGIRASYHYLRTPGNGAGDDLAARRRECEKKLGELRRSYERLPTTSRASALLDAVQATLARCALAVRRPRSASAGPAEGERTVAAPRRQSVTPNEERQP